MVLNFFKLINSTQFSFDIVNSENSSDNYTAGPNSTTNKDVWLAQGNGSKGVEITAIIEGSLRLKLIYMWDHDWAIRFRIGAQERNIPVDSNKDFWIEVNETDLVFKCYNGKFTGTQESLLIKDWPGLITTGPLKEDWDTEDIDYAEKFVSYSREKRAAQIEKANKKQKLLITNLVDMWDLDFLEPSLTQTTLFEPNPRNGWRIDLQDNGSVERQAPDGSTMRFFNIAVQFGRGRDNVYAHVMVPVGYNVGQARIRQALMESMRQAAVAWILPPRPGPGNLPSYRSTEAQRRNIQALLWMVFVAGCVVRAEL